MKSYKKLIAALMGPLPAIYGTNAVSRLIGFHFCWHALGGIEGLRKAGWTEGTIWRSRREFRKAFGEEVETAFPELAETARRMAGIDADV